MAVQPSLPPSGEAPPTRRKRRRLRWVLLTLGLLFVFLVAWVFWPVSWPALQVSPRTTHVTAPLNADGTVNYVAALNGLVSEGVTPENNAAMPLLQALGGRLIPAEVRAAVLAELGAPVLPGEEACLVPLNEYVAARQPAFLAVRAEEVGWDRAGVEFAERAMEEMDTGFSPEVRALLEQWLDESAQPQELVVQASQCSRFYLPLVSTMNPPLLMESPLPDHALLRWAGKAICLRGGLRLADGQLDAALADAHAIRRLGLLYGQGALLITKLVGQGVYAVGVDLDRRIACDPRLTAQQAQARLAQLRQMPDPADPLEGLRIGERYMALDAVMHLARSGKATAGGPQVMPRVPGLALDINEVLARVNSYFDRIARAAQADTYADRQRAMEVAETECGGMLEASSERLATASGWFGLLCYSPPARRQQFSIIAADMLMTLLLPSFDRAHEFWTRVVMERHLVEAALGLAAWHAEKGDYPVSLEALVPDYLPQVPQDLFTGQPLHYTRTQTGYLLYSVGPNGQDDGGVPASAATIGDAYDLVIRVGQAAASEAAQTQPAAPEAAAEDDPAVGEPAVPVGHE